MRSCLVVLFLLAGVAPAAAQAVADEWVFGRGGMQLEYEGARDYTLRPLPVDRNALQTLYFDEFTPGGSGLEFSPSFRVIAGRSSERPNRPRAANVEVAPADAGIVTYRYDTKRRRFTVRRGLNDREG
jgi:hypothetical protein